MKLETRKQIFETHFSYWIIKLGLDKKYKFILKQDNRMNAFASIDIYKKKIYDDVLKKEYLEPQYNIYEVRFNCKKLTAQYKIIHTLLHEIGHTFYDFRIKDDIMHEAEAEYFALSTIKKEMPKIYKKCLRWTKDSIEKAGKDEEIHKQGYILALKKLKEI
jgi:hypothetical protein